MSSHTHLGIRFDVWDNQGAWFWRVVNAVCHTSLIGAAPKQADAEREARSSIEELSSKLRDAASFERFEPNLTEAAVMKDH